MADPVALVSVLSSAAIAGGTLWVNYRNGHEQRTHEAGLAFEARVWEVKSDALFEAISTAIRMLDHLGVTSPFHQAEVLSRALRGLDDVVAQVEAYASDECRTAFTALRTKLVESKVPPNYHTTVEFYHDQWFKALNAEELGATAPWHERETEYKDRTVADMVWDPDALKPLAEALIAEARKSVRASG